MDYQMPLGPQDTNTLNVLASTLGRASQFGSFLSKNYIGELGPRVTAFIPYGPLAEDRFNPLNMAMTITNFAAHVSKCCMGTFGFVEEAKNA
jgi:hypothetical protein